MKKQLKRVANAAGIYIANTQRFGLDADLDLKRLTTTEPVECIFDVGANFGQTAIRLADHFSGASIFSFEPVESSFQRLRSKTSKISRVNAFNFGFGEVRGTAEINLAESAGSNSINKIFSDGKTEEIEINTIDHFCDQHSIDQLDLLKIDVEGFELPVLKGAETKLKSGKIRYVYAECVLKPNAEMPHTSFFDLHNFLSERGFCFVSYYAESFNLRLGCALGNVLYAYTDRLPENAPGTIKNII